jgi:putative copper resistance protein D
VSFVVVALSGATEAVYRLGPSRNLGADYGILLLTKVVILAAAAAVLLVFRARTRAPAMPRFLALELGLLAIAFGVSAVLPSRQVPIARSVPANATPAEILTSHPLPAPFGFANLLGEWRLDLGWALAFAFAAVLYVAGVRRLRRRGDHWPVDRTILWFAGLALAAWLTSGGPAVYRNTLFSVDVTVSLAWSLVVPLLLLQGAPLALAYRTLHTRTDGSRSAREWLRAFSRSRIVRFFAHPVAAAVVFAGSVWAFSVGPLLRWSTVNSFGHGWAALQLFVAGLLLVHALTARTSRLRTGWRLLLLAGVTAALVATGLWAVYTDELLLADWFGAMGRTWGAPPSVDQVTGGTAFWIGSIVVAAALAAIIVTRRRDSRAARASAARPSRRVL